MGRFDKTRLSHLLGGFQHGHRSFFIMSFQVNESFYFCPESVLCFPLDMKPCIQHALRAHQAIVAVVGLRVANFTVDTSYN